MSRNQRPSTKARLPRWYRGADVPRAEIRRFARQVAERFQPEKIILFGSHAYGTPHADSDVDILVIMPARNQIDQACRIDDAFDPPFALDLIVRTPKNLAWRLAEGDSFLHEIMTKGKVLYEKADGPVGGQGRGRLSVRRPKRQRGRPLP
jgi:predicted nucleotidyltransferase